MVSLCFQSSLSHTHVLPSILISFQPLPLFIVANTQAYVIWLFGIGRESATLADCSDAWCARLVSSIISGSDNLWRGREIGNGWRISRGVGCTESGQPKGWFRNPPLIKLALNHVTSDRLCSDARWKCAIGGGLRGERAERGWPVLERQALNPTNFDPTKNLCCHAIMAMVACCCCSDGAPWSSQFVQAGWGGASHSYATHY